MERHTDFIFLIALVGIVQSAGAQEARFHAVAALDPLLDNASTVCMSPDAQAFGGRWVTEYATPPSGYCWVESEGVTTFEGPGQDCFNISVRAVSNAGGSVAGQFYSRGDDTAPVEAFVWRRAGALLALGHLYAGSDASEAMGISPDGNVVCGYSESVDGWNAFRWTEADGMASLGDLPGGVVFSEAWDVSADKSTIVGRSVSSDGIEAFRWTETDGMQGLGDLPGGPPGSQTPFASRAHAVSADGATVVGQATSSNGDEAFRWTAQSGMAPLGDLVGGEFDSVAYAVSGDGSVVVGAGGVEPYATAPYCTAASAAFIWDAGNGMRELRSVLTTEYGLNLAGWKLMAAHSISEDGLTVSGLGWSPDNQTRWWVAYLGTPVDCHGDLNGDQHIGLVDLATLLANYGAGQIATYEDGDLNGDTVVDLNDLSYLLSKYGQACP